MLKRFKREVASHPIVYILLGIILAVGFWVRVYRVPEILGFYFDQGRDALVIWDLWHKGKFFLIGPTTGLAGIFRGPYYYYLIAPFYLLGGGDPVWPAVFLAFTTVLAVALIYYLGFKIGGRATGIIAAILASFSFYIVIASRWLSNPTPMLLLSLILVWAMFKVAEGKKWAWPVIALTLGLSLFNFGSSGELFYFPALLVFAVLTVLRQGYGGRSSLNNKVVAVSCAVFVITFLPLVIFDLKHEHILLNNFTKTFGQEKSFTRPTKFLFESRNEFYVNLFPKTVFHLFDDKEKILLAATLLAFVVFLPKFIKSDKVGILLLLLMSVILGLYFYQGNYTVLYEYYMTGYFLIFLLLVAVVLGRLFRYKTGQIFVVIFILWFLKNNSDPLSFVLGNKSEGPESIAFVNQKQAIDWVYKDANGSRFNVDVYVPPVIPYAYDYLFKWYPKTPELIEERIPLLYTLYEVDGPHPERLDAWLARQKGIGRVRETVHFGGITVERRTRI